MAACLLVAGGVSIAEPAPVTDTLLAPLTTAYLNAVEPGDAARRHVELIGTVLEQVRGRYARDVDVPLLVGAALQTLQALPPGSGKPAEVFGKAMNAALGALDPHSRYLDTDAMRAQRTAIAGAFTGVGLQLEMVDGLVRVVAPIPDTPAARAGVKSGDFIVRLNEEPVHGMTLAQAASRIRGKPGTPITLMIRRGGEEDVFTVSLVRETIRRNSVRWRMEGDVLVLRIARFTAWMTVALERAIAEATAWKIPRVVVLDLRGNPGGLLRQAVRTADMFLSAGEIVSLRGRTVDDQRSWHTDPDERLAGVPMVVLVDGRTASAAELVAAALQENGRAIVMGRRSFGKGSVQTMIPLGEGQGGLRLTTALYYGPSGRTVQRVGVSPDIELVPAAAGNRRREADRAHALPGADTPLPPLARVDESSCARARRDLEPAMACALAFIESGGIGAFVEASLGER